MYASLHKLNVFMVIIATRIQNAMLCCVSNHIYLRRPSQHVLSAHCLLDKTAIKKIFFSGWFNMNHDPASGIGNSSTCR